MYHFTLAHRAISIAIRIKKWTLPFVIYADQAKTKKRTAKAQSTASKNEGCKEEPGFRTKEKNADAPTSDSDGMFMLWTGCRGWIQTLINNTTGFSQVSPQPSLARYDARQKQMFVGPTRFVRVLECKAEPGSYGTNPKVQLTLKCARQFEIFFSEKEYRLWSRDILGIITFVESTPRRCPKYGKFEAI